MGNTVQQGSRHIIINKRLYKYKFANAKNVEKAGITNHGMKYVKATEAPHPLHDDEFMNEWTPHIHKIKN